MKKMIWVVMALCVLPGCERLVSSTRGATKVASQLVMTDSEERKLGLQYAGEIKAQQKVLDNAQVQGYVKAVGAKLMTAVPATKKKFPYEFTVLDSNEVNAFALPGGQIFVYAGLIKTAATESELAGVLAHEIAHITEGHSREQMVSQYGIETLSGILLGKNQGALTQTASQIAAQGYMSAYSRDNENEADEVGLGYLSKAGFAPAAMSRFFTTLQSLGSGSANLIDAFFASHPDSGLRAQTINSLIAKKKLGAGAEEPLGGIKVYKAMLK